ncbi:Isoleucyl-tRNA synthetase, cytoplasmic [Echinococcus granulosus]|uniref:Isoleucine--tRNA ligase, cytoplasmic n=1 Tax=Echinococcus granulosus TaxID=6210 RepID=W6U9I0_ECHGR|nr:Isoleucyl-tRNA synthetase, cytoplasmic [Echinococcus granulosus]EUB57660.1 Isoleucyl-tRNA synthetase, cytoplasmic [Echinococcus granulosus]
MSRDDLPPSINFSEEEEKIIQFHNEIEAFKTSCRLSAKRPPFTFYDGPPFATGLPHYGHILAGTIKDVVTRFAYSEGYHVERHFGWDCHGLPVEYEVDKLNNISGPQDVEAMGVAAYNAKCREIVMRYSSQWRSVVQRIGRWIDFDDDYRTMYPTFMESVWWVFKQLYEKGLVYRGVKVMPFSTACSTPLSNFEAGLNYKDVQDPAIVVSFPVEDFDNSASTVCIELLAWTTTPWTLPSNLALCVNPEKDYVKIKDKSRDRVFIIMECRLEWFYKKADDYEVLEKMKGKKLIGLKYKPLFDYFIGLKELRGAFRVVGDAYVTEETGTGVVHQAPYFGEDDFRVCLREGIVTKEMATVCPVDASGRFTAEVKDFAGQYVKDADRSICQHLKHAGRLVQQSTLQHSYPFCWRSDTPLLYKAVPTWFVRVECLVERLLANSAATYWVPEFIKEKRFANWLRDARDWAISRNRYWGTPIPLWVSEDFEEVVCIGSVDELERLSGHCVTDLHKEFVDPITIPSRMGKGELRRISEVFDCWFESGSMPYAQMHYPFENAERFNSGFPADFVAEGVDQTRGWFYTLFVLSTALFNQPPFRNLIVNGIVLASDGQKMSKRQKNYPDPCKIVEQYGADALRLYLVNSPVVRAQSLRFSEWGVRDVLKDVFIPWYNAFRFLMKSGIEPWERVHGTTFRVRAEAWPKSRNLMDRWILSFTQSLLLFVRTELRAYRLYTVVPRLVCFIEQLVNWYIRMNRRRLKGEAQPTLTANGATMDAEEDWYGALHTLVKVFFQLIFVMAPFAPFFTEFIYQRLKAKLDFSEFPLDGVSDAESGAVRADGAPASVHYLVGVSAESGGIDTALEERVAWMQAAVELGRSIRTRHDLPLKAPLPAAVVIHPLAEAREAVTALASYVTEELNIRNLTVTDDKTTYRVRLRARLNPVLGARLRARLRLLAAAVAALPQSSLEAYLTTGEMTVEGERLSGDDVTVDYVVGDEDNDENNNTQAKKLKAKLAENGKAPVEVAEGPKYKAQADGKGLLVLLDVRADTELEEERVARELINRIQRARKKAMPEDAIQVVVSTMSEVLAQVLTSHTALIDATVKQPIVCCTMEDAALTAATAAVQARGERLGDIVVSDATTIPPDDLVVTIFHRIASTKDTASHSTTAASKSHVPGEHSSMRSLKVRCPVVGESIDVCLVDATGKQLISGVVELLDVVRGAFDWRLAANLRLMHSGTELTCDSTVNVLNLAGQELCLL